MTVRTLSFLLAVVLWNVQRPVAIVALALGFILPYVAVVIANAGRERPPSLPSTHIVTSVRPSLGPAPGGDAPEDVKESPGDGQQPPRHGHG
jgi:hypothetical protein